MRVVFRRSVHLVPFQAVTIFRRSPLLSVESTVWNLSEPRTSYERWRLNMRNSRKLRALSTMLVVSSLLLVLGFTHARAQGGKPDWQKHIDWSIGNHTTDPGETNCPDQYAATEPNCILGGGRACLMARAIDSAKANNYAYAFRLTLITQCHNGGAQQAIGAAGQQAVGDYLKTK